MRIEAGKEEIIKYSYTKFDPRDIGDYPPVYCGHCFQIGRKYLDQISIEQERFDTIIEKIEMEWKD